jgi:flavin reductase (DIM6/NTAB) family NADH-FMN oxidoreductase RutF
MTKHIQNQTGENLREAMRYWASGVGVLGAEHQGTRHGMTVSSFTSLSIEPPLVMVSLQKSSRTHNLVVGSEAFAVTLLAEGQREISDLFAGLETEQDDRFAGLQTFTLETGSPLLREGLAFFDCRVVGQYDAGTNTVMIGEVVAAQTNPRGEELAPLVYFNRDYRKITGLRPPA